MRSGGRLGPLLAVLIMVLFGVAVYMTLGSTRSAAARRASPPPPPAAAKPSALTLPGTLVLAQDGGLYSFRSGVFSQLAAPGGWSQPAAAPDGSHLVAVRRGPNVSDLYQLGFDGSIEKQLTHNAARIVEVNHWAFYPRYGADSAQLFYSTDRPKIYDYRVDLAVWSMPAAGGAGRQWTRPEHYSGGDVQPQPVPGGGLIYTRYSVDSAGASVSQVMFLARPLGAPVALTQAAERCSMPQLSPDLTQLAMVCLNGPRTSQLVVAPFSNQQLGPRDVWVEGTLASAPAWSPDSTGLAYLAPGADDPGGGFQLWSVGVNAPSRQLTSGLSFDALSPPVWLK